jgi:hypothetical protein
MMQRRLGPIPAAEFAGWIQSRFDQAGCGVSGIGAACVALGNGHTSDLRELSNPTFSIGSSVGKFEIAAVRRAWDERLAEKTAYSTGWQKLSERERNLVFEVATGRTIVASAGTSSAMRTLIDRGWIRPTIEGVRVVSPSIRQWTLDFSMSARRKEFAAVGPTSNTSRVSFNFSLGLSRRDVRSIGV